MCGWNYLPIPKLQRCNRWSLGRDKSFHPTIYWECDYLFMLGLKLIHDRQRGYWTGKLRGVIVLRPPWHKCKGQHAWNIVLTNDVLWCQVCFESGSTLVNYTDRSRLVTDISSNCVITERNTVPRCRINAPHRNGVLLLNISYLRLGQGQIITLFKL